MKPLLTFNPRYFTIAVVLFIVEVLIAKYAHDQIVRPYIGDVLVVILVFCFVKAFFNTPVLPTALSVLLFSFLIEGLQYANFIQWLGLQHSKMAPLLLGNAFAWLDVLAYIVGIGLVLLFEKIILHTSAKNAAIQSTIN